MIKIYLTSTVDHNANRPEASNIEILIPRHFKDAKSSPQSDKWQDAMKEEIKVMKERDVWELVPTPQDSKVIGCRWVYTLKTDSKGKIFRIHSRTPLVLIAGTLNSQRYISEVLEPVVLPYLQGLAIAIFQQDNARPHVHCPRPSTYCPKVLRQSPD
ncbi:retrovirus-related Pol polyprotein from transposon TNT 1-94 [Trichonephila clavipes]|nr:retrovirus-related Pol polyprotein from transposon TNT 1-94 [Trichonephila clavipes]